MTPHYNHLNEMVLMMGHKICFYDKIWLSYPKIIPVTLSCLTEADLMMGHNFCFFLETKLLIIAREANSEPKDLR